MSTMIRFVIFLDFPRISFSSDLFPAQMFSQRSNFPFAEHLQNTIYNDLDKSDFATLTFPLLESIAVLPSTIVCNHTWLTDFSISFDMGVWNHWSRAQPRELKSSYCEIYLNDTSPSGRRCFDYSIFAANSGTCVFTTAMNPGCCEEDNMRASSEEEKSKGFP